MCGESQNSEKCGFQGPLLSTVTHAYRQAGITHSSSLSFGRVLKYLCINIDKFSCSVNDGSLSNLDHGIAIVDEKLTAKTEQDASTSQYGGTRQGTNGLSSGGHIRERVGAEAVSYVHRKGVEKKRRIRGHFVLKPEDKIDTVIWRSVLIVYRSKAPETRHVALFAEDMVGSRC